MSTKNLHYKAGYQFLQLGDYQYNIRGWLSKFNNPSTSVPGGSYRDLLAFELHYNSGATGIVSGTANQYNGNISGMQWQVLGEGNEVRAYAFSYDKMNRLTQALYREKTSSAWNVNTGRYDVKDLTYDKNGNIKTLKRYGQTGTSSFGLMDDLNYTYKNAGKSNQLAKVTDSGLATGLTSVEQFVDGNTSGDDYGYDNSGNLKQDKNKNLTTITYNHLNKPTEVEINTGVKKITYIYDAAGSKLRQKVFGMGGTSSTKETDYIGPFHYEDSDGDGSGATPEMLFFSHEEGRVRRAGTELVYETFLKDHLGNVRVMFADLNEDGWVDPDPAEDEVLQIDHYYPFGLRLSGASTIPAPAEKNSYLYNGNELQDELGLGLFDFNARFYDPATGRFVSVDPLAELQEAYTPYHYVYNDPINHIDPEGLMGYGAQGGEEDREYFTSTFIGPDFRVIEHRQDGDPNIYMVDDVEEWRAGGSMKDGLSIKGREVPGRTYRKGEKYDPTSKYDNLYGTRPQGGSATPIYPVEEFLVPGPIIFKYVRIGGKWALVAIGKSGNRFIAWVSGKLATRGVLKYEQRTLQHMFSRHAKDFGVTSNWSKTAAAEFEGVLKSHMQGVKPIQGTYRGTQKVMHYFDSKTGRNVMTDLEGNLVGGWKLSTDQIKYLQTTGAIK